MRLLKCFIVVVVGMAIVTPAWPKVSLFSVDAASFKLPGDWAYLEVYTLIPRKNLRYEEIIKDQDTTYAAAIELVCSVMSGEIILASDTLDAVDSTTSMALITHSQNLPYVFTFQIRAGTYQLTCQLIDRKRGMGDVTKDDLIVPDFPDEELAISDVELAISINREYGGSRFHKNGYLVYPNPQNIYGESLPRLSYYAELYNLPMQSGVQGLYYVDVDVLDSEQKPLRSYERKIMPIAGQSMVEIGGFPVTTFNSGTYYLKLTLEDSTTGEKTSRFKKFFVWHPSQIAEHAITVSDGSLKITFPTDYALLDESQLESALEDIQYLLTQVEKRQIKKLNLDGKRAFLDKFWESRDPDLSTPENERRTEHYRRLAEANHVFGYLDIPGWKTDRGRIWVLYGCPESEDSRPMEIDARAYRIWFFDQIEGGVEFVFVDRAGFGNFELVHSTKKGEIYNSNWYEMEVQGYRTREAGRSLQPSSDDEWFWRE